MRRDDLPTVGYLDECFRTILGHIEAIKRPAPAPEASAAVVLLTIEQVMEHLSVSRSAVQRWTKVGKRGRNKQLIKLAVLTFGEAEPRIPWPALLAFGRGEAYDLAQLPAPQLPAALPVPAGALPALRLAS
ncbi:hypothetical protein I2I05_19005 [Hymenobacter sp. BT683]|uniref:Helix-turn-helix domain-containing protein n=1 Tax=Hymenobacter jeongseonensis TaxID=2791027 RepID=A0ABS0IMA5_9BACT|nr:hypothetical protein [Hymenobacter jeongseonensis]MBF9239490.1 hypothetical protein [Hymenobacter jeongseonensis]